MKNLAILFLIISSNAFSAIEIRTYQVTDNSYYRFTQQDFSDPFGALNVNEFTLTGTLLVRIDDLNSGGTNYSLEMDFSNILMNGNQISETFIQGLSKIIETQPVLSTDGSGFASGELVSGFSGDPNYQSFGNSTLSPSPFICVECGYQMKLKPNASPFAGDPLLLSYDEYNIFETGRVNFSMYVSEVPLPFGFSLLGF